MTLPEWLNSILGKIITEWWDESAVVWRAFWADFVSIWTPGPTDFALLLNPVALQLNVLGRVIDTIDVFQELTQDLFLVPFRISVDVVDDLIPVPDSWKGRVFRADQALRFFTREILEFGVDILDLDLPAEVDAALAGGKLAKLIQFFEKGADRLTVATKAGKAHVVVLVVTAIGNLLKWIALLILVLLCARVLQRMHGPEGEGVLKERSLSQNSKRVRRDLGVRQTRVNTRRGDD